MLKYMLAMLVLLSYTSNAKAQISTRAFSDLGTDTVFIGIQNNFHVIPGAKLKSYDRNSTSAIMKDNKLTLLPHKKGLFQVELLPTDTSQTIRKTFYATHLPPPANR